MPSHTCTKMAFFTADKKLSEFQNSCVLIKKKDLKITNIVIVTINIGNRTLCRPIRAVIILVIKKN